MKTHCKKHVLFIFVLLFLLLFVFVLREHNAARQKAAQELADSYLEELIRGDPARTDAGWDAAKLEQAQPAPSLPAGISLSRDVSAAEAVQVLLRNSGADGWVYDPYAPSELHVLLAGCWYHVPSAYSAGDRYRPEITPSLEHLVPAGETLDISFTPSAALPAGHYRRIWNGVTVEFEIGP